MLWNKGGKKINGDVLGIEVEVEANGGAFPSPEMGMNWRKFKDGSLRGVSAEYVTKRPKGINASKENVVELFRYFKAFGVMPKVSPRTSVHVHYNMTDKSVKQIASIIFLYYIFERMLLSFCGKRRKFNHFCLSVFDAEAPLFYFEDILCKENEIDYDFLHRQFRYASLNLAALYKYGTLEWRGLGGTVNVNKIILWIDIIDSIVQFGKKMSPIDLLEFFSSGVKEEDFVKSIFEENSGVIFSYPNWKNEMKKSLRLVQELCFIRDDWDKIVMYMEEPMEDI